MKIIGINVGDYRYEIFGTLKIQQEESLARIKTEDVAVLRNGISLRNFSPYLSVEELICASGAGTESPASLGLLGKKLLAGEQVYVCPELKALYEAGAKLIPYGEAETEVQDKGSEQDMLFVPRDENCRISSSGRLRNFSNGEICEFFEENSCEISDMDDMEARR